MPVNSSLGLSCARLLLKVHALIPWGAFIKRAITRMIDRALWHNESNGLIDYATLPFFVRFVRCVMQWSPAELAKRGRECVWVGGGLLCNLWHL